ncbi:hypothetical protein NL676_017137 [Syzygium grande]|nr:hypothetical protein NL676_017137 [Syzygium grande]
MLKARGGRRPVLTPSFVETSIWRNGPYRNSSRHPPHSFFGKWFSNRTTLDRVSTFQAEALGSVKNSIFPRHGALRLQAPSTSKLAAVSLASAGLRRASLSVAARRSSDAARGLEPLPVPFLNAVDSSRPYAYFLYAPSSFSRSLAPLRQPWGSSSRTAARPTAFPSGEAADVVVGGVVLGCGCERCEGRGCACWGGDGGGEEEVVVVSECGPGCGCASECGNRASQRGVEVRLKIARDKKKGWCLFADQAIEKGRFVCEYAGELLTTKEARARQKEYDELASSGGFSSALLVVREHLPSGKACLRINIDATKVGNVGEIH